MTDLFPKSTPCNSHGKAPALRKANCLNWIDGGLQWMESQVFGCHSVRLRQSDSLLSFGNSFELSLFVIRREPLGMFVMKYEVWFGVTYLMQKQGHFSKTSGMIGLTKNPHVQSHIGECNILQCQVDLSFLFEFARLPFSFL